MVFSGVIPMNTPPEEHSAWRCAIEFGAKCHHKLSHTVTHVIANKVGRNVRRSSFDLPLLSFPQAGTDKVNHALRMPNVKVVWARWFYMCMALWQSIPITDEYLVEPTRHGSKPPQVSCTTWCMPMLSEVSNAYYRYVFRPLDNWKQNWECGFRRIVRQ
jgi:RNA polymerase II subunit A C-terminal domain phosphatase